METHLAVAPAFAMTLWFNGFTLSPTGPVDPRERLWPPWWPMLFLSPCEFSSHRLLTKVAWDFLLCPVQEDAAVRVKIAHWIAFNGSRGERGLREVPPL